MVDHPQTRSFALPFGLDAVSAALLGFVLCAAVAASNGGFLPTSWAWVALASFLLATLRLILAPRWALQTLDMVLLGGLAAFGVWLALSAFWSPSTTQSLREVTRALAYVGAVFLCLLLVRRRTVPTLLAAALAGVSVVSGYALLSRLAPDRIGSWDPTSVYRLSDPIGYWNGLGIYAAMGTLLALGFVARSKSPIARAVAGLLPVILVTTVFFTFSRGAWLGLAVGLAAAVALDPRRLQLLAAALVLAPWPAIAIVYARHSNVLTDRNATLADLTSRGHTMLALVCLLAGISGAVALAFGEIERRVTVPGSVRRGFAAALVALLLIGVATVWVDRGSPWTLAHRGWNSFTAPSKTTGTDVSARLFDLSANGRVDLWRVSFHQFRHHPLAGAGAGSFQQAWLKERPTNLFARDGHSLYFETLGELGIVGLVLLLAALFAPVVGAVRARRDTFVPGAFAAYAAYLAHAGVDWDWELAGVTLVALVAAVGLVVSARGDEVERELISWRRIALPAVAACLALLSAYAVVVYVPLERARTAYDKLNIDATATQAQRAVDRAPWSSDALDLLGRAQLAQGHRAAAKASFVKAVAKSPDDWEIWRDLALASGVAHARAPLERALALNPRDPQLTPLLALVKQRESKS